VSPYSRSIFFGEHDRDHPLGDGRVGWIGGVAGEGRVVIIDLEKDAVAVGFELMKRNGVWQSKTPAEQEGWLRHMHEEHVTPEDIGKMAAKADVKAVVMTHLGPSVDPNDDYQRYIGEAKKYFSGPITIARDLMKF
jgi:hypothetical protein